MREISELVESLVDSVRTRTNIVTENIHVAGMFGASSSEVDRVCDTEELCTKDGLLARITQEITFSDDDSKLSLYKRISEVILQNPGVSYSISTFKSRNRAGYSEYTSWWTTITSSGEIEVIDEDELFRAIDEFSETFNEE